MTIEEALKNSGTKKNALMNKSIKAAQEMIQIDEEIIYATEVGLLMTNNNTLLMDSTKELFSLKNVVSGTFVVTNKRILFCNKMLGILKCKQISIKDITSIEENTNNLVRMGQLKISSKYECMIINIYRSELVNPIKESIFAAQRKIEIVDNHQEYRISNADEILKFKKLLDDGIITQEEFEKKKKQLLE